MIAYHLQGVIHPRRAQIREHPFGAKFKHVATGHSASLSAQVLMNELSVWVESEDEWDVFDLKNVVRYNTQTELAFISYLTGCAYSVEIVRIICREKRIDLVYGIDVPCIAARTRKLEFEAALAQLKQISVGESGVYVQRSMNDLLLAMQHPEDTAFFCYRAIEALKNHAMSLQPDSPKSGAEQWKQFREMARCDRADIDFIKNEADPVRHSNELIATREDRETLFARTWDIVGGYIGGLIDK